MECDTCGAELDPDDEDGLCDKCEAPHPFEGGSGDDEVADIDGE